ncbi:MAG: hypothetical protein ACK5RE_12585 [Pseudanabaena sp.]
MATAAEYESMIKSLQWDALRSLWDNIEKRNTPDWESGKAFEYLTDVTWKEQSVFEEERN